MSEIAETIESLLDEDNVYLQDVLVAIADKLEADILEEQHGQDESETAYMWNALALLRRATTCLHTGFTEDDLIAKAVGAIDKGAL